MAKGKKTGGRNFSKDNPGGKRKLPPEIKAARKITTENYIAVVNKLLNMSINGLSEISRNKDSNSLEACVAAAILFTHKMGDPARLEYLLNRAIGKVKDTMEIKTPPQITFMPAETPHDPADKN